jgi:hypothetical protein
MESTSRKIFKQLGTVPFLSVAFFFIFLSLPIHSIAYRLSGMRVKDNAYPFQRSEAPKILLRLHAPMSDRTCKYVGENEAIRAKFDNSYKRTDLIMPYLPNELTIKDHFKQILVDG